MPRYAVTGGAGFIGSHLVEVLLEAGNEVLVVDNFETGRTSNINLAYNKINIVEVDISDPSSQDSLVDAFKGCDGVLHLAALADIVPSIERPQRYFEVNVDGTFNVVMAAKAAGVRKLVYAASSSCYGLIDEIPTTETAPVDPQYLYALTKLLGEQIVLGLGKTYGLRTVSLRLFNVYGKRARTAGTYGAVLGVFMGQYFNNLPLTIVGDGEQLRDFVHVKDVANAFKKAVESDVDGVILNIGGGSPWSVNDLANLISEERVFIPKRPGEPDVTHADISLAKAVLDWSPQIGFAESIKDLKRDSEEWKDAPAWSQESVANATHQWFKFLGDS